jgi:hypothetical protein
MHISEIEMDRESLEQFAKEVALLIQKGDFSALAERFGYAMTYGREPAEAIERDLSSTALERANVDRLPSYIDIKYFNVQSTKSTGLLAAVDCQTYLAGDALVQFSLVVTMKGSDRYMSLESIDRLQSNKES